jgi:hypothetical protein
MARSTKSTLVVLAIGAMLLVGACSGADERSSDTSADEASAGDAGGASAARRAELNRGPAAGTQLEDRDIVYSGSITIRVRDAEDAATDAAELAGGAGGFVAAQDSQLEGDREISMTLRVPSDRFEEVADQAAELGVVQARTVDSEDVTDQVVDLEGRLENAQASAKRLRELLATAQVLDNMVVLEERLAQRESDIEQIQGQLEVLDDRVTLASLDLTLTEKAAPTVSDDLPGPLESLRAGAVAVGNLLLLLLAAVAFLVPFSPFLLGGWWLWRRRARSKRAKRAAEAEALRPPPPAGWPAATVGAGPGPADSPLGTSEDAP